MMVLLVNSLFIVNCASWNRSKDDVFRDSTLSNLNPAPESMSPPHFIDKDTATVDPTYVRAQADYYYSLGEAYSMEGETEKAVEAFKLTLVYDPDASKVRLRLAVEYIKQGLLSEAIEQSEEAIKLDPNGEDGRLLLGNLYASLKMYKQAMKQFQQLAIIHPENSEVPFYMGAVKAEEGEYEMAIQYLEQAATHPQAKKAHAAYYYMGKVWASRGENFYPQAEKAFTKSLTAKPDYVEAVLALAAIYQKQDKEQKAVKLAASFQEKFGPSKTVAHFLSQYYISKAATDNKYYTQALEQLKYLEDFEPDNLNIKMNMAIILLDQKQYNKAIDKLEEILVQSPNSGKVRYDLGRVYEIIGEYDNAIRHYSFVDSTNSYYAESIIRMTNLYVTKEKLSKAIDEIEKAIGNRSDIPQFYSVYALLLEKEKRYDDAVNMLEKAVVKYPNQAQLHFYLGSLFDRRGQRDKTITSLKQAIKIDENHVQSLNYLAYTYAEENIHLNEAEELAQRALLLKPEDGFILDTLGWIYFKQGNIKESIKYLEAAYKVQPKESVVAEHLGDAYYKHQLVEKAKLMYMKAVAHEEDQAKLERIKRKIFSIENQRVAPTQRTPASASSN